MPGLDGTTLLLLSQGGSGPSGSGGNLPSPVRTPIGTRRLLLLQGKSGPRLVRTPIGRRRLLLLQGVGKASLPPNLMAAIQAKATADASLAGIVGGFLRGALPPVGNGVASPASYCVFRSRGASPYFKSNTSEWKDERICFRVYATDGDTAEALGRALQLSIPKWGPLFYQNGTSIPLFGDGIMNEPTPNRRTGDKAAWYVEVNFSARCRLGS